MESVLHKSLSSLGNSILTLWGMGVRGLFLKITVPLRFSYSTVTSSTCYRLLTGGSLSLPFYLWSPTPKLLEFTFPQVGSALQRSF